MRIVLTRHPGQAGDLEAAVQAAGFDVGFMPLTHQVLPADVGDLTRTVDLLERGSFDWLLLTSANTVRALRRCGWIGQLPEHTTVAAVGPGTAKVLQEFTEVRDLWMPKEHSAAGLLAELAAPTQGQRMLLPQSAQARPELADGLRARGWDLTHITAYQTVAAAAPTGLKPPPRHLLPPPAADEAAMGRRLEPSHLHREDLVLLTSSTAAEAYAQLRLARAPRLWAIGDPTARTMDALGLPVAAVLAAPTAAGLTDALNHHGFSPAPPSLDWEPDAGTESARGPHQPRHGGD